MPDKPLEKFQSLLRELFQFEHGDLNFGIYRIMNLRRAQMERWINDELPPTGMIMSVIARNRMKNWK